MESKVKKNDLLKIIAIVTMLIDHVGLMFFPDVLIFRTIGRIAFPIFAYYLAMGYTYTSNKQKYILRLIIFAFISQLPYIYLNTSLVPNMFHFNVIFLLLYAIGMLYVYDKFEGSLKRKDILFSFLYFLGFLIILILPDFLSIVVDGFLLSYGTYGLVMILLFYKLKDKPYALFISYIIMSVVFAYLSGVPAIVRAYGGGYFETLVNFNYVWDIVSHYKNGLLTLQGFFFQSRSIMGLVLIIILSRVSYRLSINKYIAYYFYPIHIAIIVLLKMYVF